MCLLSIYCIHPSISDTHLSFGGGLEPISALTLGERQGTPLTGYFSVTGLTYTERQPFPFDLESPININCMFLDCGRKPKHPENMQNAHRKVPAGRQAQCSTEPAMRLFHKKQINSAKPSNCRENPTVSHLGHLCNNNNRIINLQRKTDPDQLPETPQLAPFDAKKQQLYSELPPDA